MADWYVSSVAYAAIPQWAASHAYSIGDIIRPLATPAAGKEYVFRVTTAGTSGTTEPTWPAANNATVTGGAVFTNVSGQSTYGWGAAAGTLLSIAVAQSNRPAAGDRVFVSSDHAENFPTTSVTYGFGAAGYGVIEILSVNRAGSVPPVEADLLAGASLSYSSGGANTLTFDALVNMYWYGFTITAGGTNNTNISFNANASGTKQSYFRNSAFVLSTTGACRLTGSSSNCKVILDNTTVQFGAIAHCIGAIGWTFELIWINTPAAIKGAIVPTALFNNSSTGSNQITCRGVDLSAITTTLAGVSSAPAPSKVLLDSCKIGAGTRLATPASGNTSADEVELVNCYDGALVLNERWSAAGGLVTDRSVTNGALDDIGAYSLRLASSSRSDFATMPLECFWLDVENTIVGSSKVATVEIASSLTLNNNDVRLLLEYMGTSGNPIASFGDSLASVLTPAAALPTSSAVWSGPAGTTWNPNDATNITFSNNFLTAAATGAAGTRAVTGFTTGKYYFEITMTAWTSAAAGPGLALLSATVTSPATGTVYVNKAGSILLNNVASGLSIGARAAGDIICIAVDVGAGLAWWRAGASGSWNATSGTANNPATGTGGLNIGALVGALFPWFLGAASGDTAAANFSTAFTGAVPSGFTAGWPGTPAVKQKLQVTFTPQRSGRVRGLVRLGKPSTTMWVNPQIAIS